MTPEQIARTLASYPGLAEYGRNYGPMTPRTRAGQPNDVASSVATSTGDDAAAATYDAVQPIGGERIARQLAGVVGPTMDYGPIPAKIAVEMAKQPVRAGEAVSAAIDDPSLYNIGNAASQTASAIPLPLPMVAGAVGQAVTDTGNAIAKDGLPSITSPANAGTVDDFRAEYSKMNPFPQERTREDFIRQRMDAAAKPFNDANAPTKGKAAAEAARIQAEKDYPSESASVEARRTKWAKDFEAAWQARQVQEREYNSRPFRERYPDTTKALNSTGLGIAALLGLGSGARGVMRANKEARVLDDLTAAEHNARTKALETGDFGPYARTAEGLVTQKGAYEAAKNAPSGHSGYLSAGAVAAVPPAVPEMLDLGMPSDTKANTLAKKFLQSSDFWAQKAALGAAGAGAYKGGQLAGKVFTPETVPNTSRAAVYAGKNPADMQKQLAEFEANSAQTGADVQALRQQRAGELSAAGRQSAIDDAMFQSAVREAGQVPMSPDAKAEMAARFSRMLGGPSPSQRQLPAPAPAENPPLPPPVDAGNTATQQAVPQGIIQQLTDKPRLREKPYAERASPAVQQYTIEKASEGIHPSAINRTQMTKDLVAQGIDTNRTAVGDGLKYLGMLGQERGIDIGDPAVLMRLAKELNKNAAINNKNATGNRLWSAAPAAGLAGMEAANDEDPVSRVTRIIANQNQVKY